MPIRTPGFSKKLTVNLTIRKKIICIPLINRNHEYISVLEALNKQHGGFDEDDKYFLNHISNYSSLIIEHINLQQEQEIINIARERIINHFSHELKTPLSSIANVFEFLSKEMNPAMSSRRRINGMR